MKRRLLSVLLCMAMVASFTACGGEKNTTSSASMGEGTEKTEGTFYHNVCGTYVHGIFDKEEVALGLVRAVGIRKGIDV